MSALDDILNNAQPARLIPAIADSRKEERIVSILLATLPKVPLFAEKILECCGERVSKSSTLSSYTEVEFPSLDGSGKDRPDGVLCLTTRKARWVAILEAKIEKVEIDEEQVHRYADLARKYQVDAVITLSNQLVPLPTHVPYSVSKRVGSHVKFFHFSWISILTQARLLLRNRKDISPEQAFILGEMSRYFEHPSSGVRRFEQMNSEWRTLVHGIRNGQQFKRTSPEIENTVASWHQEERDVCLILSRRIGEQISIRRLSRKHQAEPARRLRDACDDLISSNELRFAFSIPNAASDLEVVADMQRRTISCSMKLNAPLDKQRASARINWLRRQLRDVDGGNIQIRAVWPGRAMPTQASLSEVKADSRYLENERPGMAPTSFEIVMIGDIAGRFSGRRTFIEDLEKLIPEFYDEIGQHLRPWAPPPPSIDKDDTVQQPDTAETDQRRSGDAGSSLEGDHSDPPIEKSDADTSFAGDQ